jgi:nitroimidazol reductase NimA-like FMN-containing flavoprotein (pyridoxamine 5'-phosphate oxidase superfamily)
MPLSQTEREAFLAEPHVAALSVAAPDRAPLTVPIWYGYTPGGQPWVLTGSDARKTRLIQAAGAFTLMVDRLEPTTRYVSVSGPVSRIEPGTDEQMAELAHRYLPPDAGRRRALHPVRARQPRRARGDLPGAPAVAVQRPR